VNRGLGIALVVVGAVLVVLGFQASEAFASDVTRFFTGSTTDKSVWMLLGGILFAGMGLALITRRAKPVA
jgi:hypothetical protein